ncbi:MAG: hypothetical protein HQL54_07760 [Magnetococcales bacterium]|nr:hypothetical protein [Magnetococcales bacterium]
MKVKFYSVINMLFLSGLMLSATNSHAETNFQQTNLPGHVIDTDTIADINSNGVPEIVMLRSLKGQRNTITVTVKDLSTGKLIKSLVYFTKYFQPIDLFTYVGANDEPYVGVTAMNVNTGQVKAKVRNIVSNAVVSTTTLAAGLRSDIVVNCDNGGSIQKVIDSAVPGIALSIVAKGVCDEALLVNRDLKLTSQSNGSLTIQAGDSATAVEVGGPYQVELSDLTLTGNKALTIERNGSVKLNGVLAEGKEAGLVAMMGSMVELEADNTITLASSLCATCDEISAVFLGDNAKMIMTGNSNTITAGTAGEYAMALFSGGRFESGGGLSNNAITGNLAAYSNTTLSFRDIDVDASGYHVEIGSNSTLELSAGTTMTADILDIEFASHLEIYGETGEAVTLTLTDTLDVFSLGSVLIEGPGILVTGDVRLGHNSALDVYDGATLTGDVTTESGSVQGSGNGGTISGTVTNY